MEFSSTLRLLMEVQQRSNVVFQWSVIVVLAVLAASVVGDTSELTVTTEAPANENEHYVIDTATLDQNKDGCIGGRAELDEFKRKVAEALAGSSNRILRAHSIVYRTDVNKDGRICWCDFISIYLYDKAIKNRHIVPFMVIPDDVMFLQLDQNKDGKLSGDEKSRLEAEFSSCLPLQKAQFFTKSMAEQVDKDDAISRNEFRQFFSSPPEDLINLQAKAAPKDGDRP